MASATPGSQQPLAASKPKQNEKITLYWLNQSRSQRIVWLLEELQLDYELKIFMRGKDMLAPKELKDIHPLGKSPALTIQRPGDDKPFVIVESALIVEYLLEHYGRHMIPQRYADTTAALDPAAGGQDDKAAAIGEPCTETPEYMRYRYFMNYAEGSLMPFLVIAFILIQIRQAPVPFFIKPITRAIANKVDTTFVRPNLTNHTAFLESQLATSPGGGPWFTGPLLTGADVMLSYPLDEGGERIGITRAKAPRLVEFVERCQAREAYKRAAARIEEALRVAGQTSAAKL